MIKVSIEINIPNELERFEDISRHFEDILRNSQYPPREIRSELVIESRVVA